MIEELIFLIVYITIEIMNVTLIFTVFFGTKITESKFRIIICCVGIFALHILVWLSTGIQNASAMSLFTMALIPAFFFEKGRVRNICLYPFVALAGSILGVCFSFLLAAIINVPLSTIIQGNWNTAICECIPLIVLLILFIKTKVDEDRKYYIDLGLKQFVVFYAVAISLFFMIAPIQVLAQENPNNTDMKTIGIAISLGCITMVIVTVWQGISVKKEIEAEDKNRLYEESLEMQKEYYENLLEQEEKMRRFRHDLNAHIIALQTYADNNEIENLQEYLSKFKLESTLMQTYKFTGNKIVDALISHMKDIAEKKQISFQVKGYLAEESVTKAYDLCIILSNLLKNAIEACEKVEEIQNRKIYLEITMYEKKIYIRVKNNIKGKVTWKGKYPSTTKGDQPNHGLGYGNLQYIVEKYQGIMECRSDEKEYAVDIII